MPSVQKGYWYLCSDKSLHYYRFRPLDSSCHSISFFHLLRYFQPGLEDPLLRLPPEVRLGLVRQWRQPGLVLLWVQPGRLSQSGPEGRWRL